jgi:hypothetical protein
MPTQCNDDSVCFLLGPGRSGTTLIYKLLAMHPDVGYFSNYMAKFGGLPSLALLNRGIRHRLDLKRYSWFDSGGGAYADSGRSWLRKIVPTPSECEPTYRRCGVPDTPVANVPLTVAAEHRLRATFEAVKTLGGTSALVSKRTANNRRVYQLHRAFPRARFIMIIRDGRAVAKSLLQVNWWESHTLYWNGKTPPQTIAEGFTGLEIAARNWLEEMRSMQEGVGPIPASQLLQIRYEDLLAEPRREIGRALEFIGIDPDRSAAFWDLIADLGLRARAESWRTQWTEDERASVEKIQAETLSSVGYDLFTDRGRSNRFPNTQE